MSRPIETSASSLGPRSERGEAQDIRRIVTHSDNACPDDTATTSSHQTADVENSILADNVVSIPVDALQPSLHTSSLVDPSVNNCKAFILLPEKIFRQGITGSDLTLPIFDGSSMDIKDHLIDIDTDSMETAPDVRVYFWAVGYALKEPFLDPPYDLEGRKLFDAGMVRRGREHLKDLRQRGLGWFLSPSRDISSRNAIDSEWYRTPTTGICKNISCGTELALEDECCFYDVHEHYLDAWVVATNMRIPMWWVETLMDGVIPGTNGWDDAIQWAYNDIRHPGYGVFTGIEREDVIKEIVWAGVMSATATLERARQLLRRDWPDVAAIDDELFLVRDFNGPGFLECFNCTVDQFLGRTK